MQLKRLYVLFIFLFTAEFSNISIAKQEVHSDDWPCQQPYNGNLPLDKPLNKQSLQDLSKKWREKEEIRKLVDKLADRSTSIEESEHAIDEFAHKFSSSQRKEPISTLLAGVYDKTKQESSRIAKGLERFNRDQKRLAQMISSLSAQLAKLPAQKSSENIQTSLEQERYMNVLLFDDRQALIPFICEKHDQLQKRFAILSKKIAHSLSYTKPR